LRHYSTGAIDEDQLGKRPAIPGVAFYEGNCLGLVGVADRIRGLHLGNVARQLLERILNVSDAENLCAFGSEVTLYAAQDLSSLLTGASIR
jgi:hypothetical protein